MRNPLPTVRTALCFAALLLLGCAKSMTMEHFERTDMGNLDAPPPATEPKDYAPSECDDGMGGLGPCTCPGEGLTRPCYTGPKGTAGVGACRQGTQTCTMYGEFLFWGGCLGDIKPQAEVCSSDDDANCNGLVGCEDPVCAGLAGCCTPGDTRDCYSGAPATKDVGICKGGTQTCDSKGAWQACVGETQPATEAGHCDDGIDNDCDGKLDCDDPECAADLACKPPICAPGAKQDCYDGPLVTAGVGLCKGGSLICAADGQSWGTTCVGQVLPGKETGSCKSGLDEDCDGLVDCKDPDCNGDPACACVPGESRSCYSGPPGTDGVGICHAGTQVCNSDGSAWGACVGAVLPGVEAGACDDGLDNDCDGQLDCADANCTFEPICCESTVTYDATVYATSGSSLYIINPTDWSETQVGTYGVAESMTDIGMTPDGELYTLSSTSLYHINRTTGKATKVIGLTGSLNNALTFLPDNRLLAADASGQLKVINPVAGTVTNIGKYGLGYGSSGDLVAVGDGTMFGVSATSSTGADISTNNLLITIDTATGKATPIGSTGFANVFGLAYYGSRVIAFTGSGQILEINPVTGKGTLLAKHNHAYYGGTVSPLIPINGCM